VLFNRVPGPADISIVDVRGGEPPRPLLATRFDEYNGVISPDGRWLAYQSNESGGQDVYVRPYPDVDNGRWPVSRGRAMYPVWARDSRELFYVEVTPGQNIQVMAVPIRPGSTFSPGRSEVLFSGPYGVPVRGTQFDVSPDGKRFLMIKSATATPSPRIVVVQNWNEELKRLVDTN
jgi:Tol biopolymer transport system component